MDTYQVQAQELNYCDYLVQYFSSQKAVEEKTDEALSLLKDRQVKGFRKGKAPRNVLKNLFKKEIEDYVTVKLSTEAYKDALFETKLNPLGAPQFQKLSLENGKVFCEFRLLTKPNVELKQYKEFEIPKPKDAFIVSEKVEKSLQDLRVKHAELTVFEDNDTAQINDKVTLDIVVEDLMVAEESMRKVEKLSHEGLLYAVGQNLHPGFDDEIIGMKIGETKSFRLRLKTEKDSDLRGQLDETTYGFKVTMSMGLKSNLHPLDDELAEKEGFKNLSELEMAITAKAQNLLEQTKKVHLQQQIIQRLIKNHDFKIPEFLIEQEANRIMRQEYSKSGDQLSFPKDFYLQQAEDNLRISLILEEVRKQEPESGLSDMELVESLKRQVQENPQLTQWIIEAEKNGQIATWLANARVEYVLEWIIQTCKVVE